MFKNLFPQRCITVSDQKHSDTQIPFLNRSRDHSLYKTHLRLRATSSKLFTTADTRQSHVDKQIGAHRQFNLI